jgi:hypothetical protein
MTALLQRDVPQNFSQASKARACAARSGADEDVRCFGGGSGRGISQADSTTRERRFTSALTFHSTSKPQRGKPNPVHGHRRYRSAWLRVLSSSPKSIQLVFTSENTLSRRCKIQRPWPCDLVDRAAVAGKTAPVELYEIIDAEAPEQTGKVSKRCISNSPTTIRPCRKKPHISMALSFEADLWLEFRPLRRPQMCTIAKNDPRRRLKR